MRRLSNPYMPFRENQEQSLNGFYWRPQIILEQQYLEKIKHALAEQKRKIYAKILNPFNLSPISVAFWFPVVPSLAIGVVVTSLQEIDIYIRQAMEPTFVNIFSAFDILEFHVPSAFALLTLASCLGLFLTSKTNKLIETATNQLIAEQEERLKTLEEELDLISSEVNLDNGISLDNEVSLDKIENKMLDTAVEEKPRSILAVLNPFNLAPISMSIFFPVILDHTALGLVFHDIDYLAFAILQAVEPNDKIYSIFRFIHAQVPFALSFLAMFLAICLFLSGEINKAEQEAGKEIMNKIRESINQWKQGY